MNYISMPDRRKFNNFVKNNAHISLRNCSNFCDGDVYLNFNFIQSEKDFYVEVEIFNCSDELLDHEVFSYCSRNFLSFESDAMQDQQVSVSLFKEISNFINISVSDFIKIVHNNSSNNKKELKNRVEYYDEDGELHREDGPAVIWNNGTKSWFKHGKLHREDGPAIVYSNGSKFWYKHGSLHREDGPAVVWNNSDKEYYLEDEKVSKEEVMGDEKGYHYKQENVSGDIFHYDESGGLHREGGPAVVYNHGSKVWYKHGKRHREDGPAVVYNDGSKEYWIKGEKVSKEEVMGDENGYDHKEEFENRVEYYDEDGELHREDGPAVVYSDGSKYWYKHGERHREDGPAIVKSSGTKIWYKHGERHREDGPAIVYNSGTKKWYKYGKRHREDGPAIVYNDGEKRWFKHGECHREDGPAIICDDGTKKYYLESEKVSKEEVMGDEKGYDHKEDHGTRVEYYDEDDKLHREDGPAIVKENGSKFWYKHDKLHREDGPAVIKSNGTKRWYKHGKCHREDGPAIVYNSGTKKYYLNGEEVSKEEVMGDEKGYDYKEENEFGDVFYYNEHDELHREDGPAVVYDDGSKQWYKHGKRHREDGPAIIWGDGTKEYWIEGEQVSKEDL